MAKHTPQLWELVFRHDCPYGIRNEDGFICFLRKPFHYTGQDQRYKAELLEAEAQAQLIVAAPQIKIERNALLEACKASLELLKWGCNSKPCDVACEDCCLSEAIDTLEPAIALAGKDLEVEVEQLQAENVKFRKCLDAEWDEVAVEKILTDVEQLQAESDARLKIIEGLMELANDGSASFDDPEPGSPYFKARAIIELAEKE